MQMGMTQLMNKADQDEADDPYNKNEGGDPKWKDIKNRQDVLDCDGFSGDVTTTGVYSMSGFTANNPDFTIPNSCEPDACEFPFQVHREGANSWSVCTGMVNNEIPTNISSTFAVSSGFIYLVIPYDTEAKQFPSAGGVSIDTGTEIPDSEVDVSYVAIAEIVDDSVNQLITGSLWGDRIQVGAGDTQNAYYYYAQV
jgi:hypothetical protein